MKEKKGKEPPEGKPRGSGKRSSSTRSQRNIRKGEQQVQEMLRQSEEKYRTLAEQSLMGLVVIQDFRIIFANDAFAQICGYSIDELLSLPPEKVQAMTHPEDQALVWGRFRDRLAGKAVSPHYEYRGIRKDGTVCWLEMHSSRIEYGGKPAIQGAIIDITDRKQAEEALRQSEERYRALFDSSVIGALVLDAETMKILMSNRATAEIFGFSSIEEVIQTDNPFDFVHPEDRERVLEIVMKSLFERGLRETIDIRAMTKDGRNIWITATAARITHEGRLAGLVSFTDITDRKQAEESLRLSEQNFRDSIEKSPLGIRIATEDGKTLYVNKALLHICGYGSLEEFKAVPRNQLYTPESYIEHRERVNKRKRREYVPSNFEISIVRKDGQVRWLSVSRGEMLWNGERQFQVAYQDITEHKQAEEALQRSQAEYQDLYDNAPVCYYSLGTDGWIKRANKAGLKFLGYSLKELQRMKYLDIYADESKAKSKQLFEKFTQGIGWENEEMVYQRKNGERAYGLLSVSPILDEDGQVLESRSVVADITDRKQAEEALKHLNMTLRAIRNINQLIAKRIGRDGLLKGACGNLVKTRGYHNAWIALLDESGRPLIGVEAGLGKDFLQIMEQLKSGDLPDCGRKALKKSGAAIIEDPSSACTACPLAKSYSGRDGMSIRLEYDGKVYGLMTVSVPAGVAGRREEQELFEEVSGDIAFALHGMQQEQERRRAEEALRKSEDKHRKIFEEALDAIFIADAETGVLIDCNRAACELVGRERSELIGKHQRILHPTEEIAGEFTRTFREHLQAKEGKLVETQVITKKGEIKDVAIKANLLEFEGKKVLQGIFRDITERKQAEETLKRSEERYRQLAENAGEAIFVVQDGLIKFMNPKGSELAGYSTEELVSRPFVKFIHPDDVALVADRYARRLKGAPVPQIYDFRIIRKDGDIRWGELNAVSVSWEDREAVLCFMNDITERKKAEEALRQSEERYRTVLDEMEEGYYEVDLPGTFTFVNDAMSRILGYSRDELIGMNYKVYTPQETSKTIFQAYNHVYRTGEPLKWYPMAEVRKDGTLILAEDSVFPLRDEKGGIIGFRGVSRDVTERKKAEEVLRQSEERYRTILEEMEDSYFEVDLGGHFTFVNSATCHALAYPREEIIGMSYKKFTPEDHIEGVFRAFSQVYQTGTPNKGFSWKVIRKDGSEGYVEASASPVQNDKGEIVGFRGIGRDISERMKMEEQLILTDRLASVGQLAAGIAHELNNPLTGVIGFSDLLLERDLSADVKEDLETVNREARRAVNIVKGLLAFAREQKTEKSLVNINIIIQGVLQIRSYEEKVSNIEVDARFDPTLPLVMANGVQLQQVFINIIVNAEQAMIEAHGRGKLTIATEQVGNIVRASVTDDGPGISRDNMKQLFAPFFTTREVGKGTGLGLSICHGIVTEHGGKLHVESEPGKGATFVVELPISK